MLKTKINTNPFLQKRLVFMGGIEGMSFRTDDFEGMKEKKEKAQKEPLKVEDLVKRSNDLLKTHESRLKEFPPRFQAALHDEMVQFFRTSSDRFDQNREQGLNAIEFEKYSKAMLEKLHGILERYAPLEEKPKDKGEDAEEKLDDLMEKPQPELENVAFDSLKLGTSEGIQTELKKYGQRSAELIEQGHGLSLKIERFQNTYQQYLKEKTGWNMFTRRFWKDEETERFQQKLNNFKKDLEARLKALESKKKELAGYARDHLNPAGDRLRHAQLMERGQLVNQVGNDPEKAKKIESHYAEVLETIDKVDALVADRILDLNLQTELLLSQIEGQKTHYDQFKIDAPNVWDATVGLLFGQIGKGYRLLLVEGLSQTVLDGASDWLQDKTQNIPVVGVGTKVVTNVFLGLPSGVIEGAGELIDGVGSMVAHPIDTMKGFSTLIPIYNGTNGKWFDLRSSGHSWKEMGKAIIAYETFAEGRIGKGTSKAALNVLLTATGIGAASKGVQGGRIAYLVSRTEAGVLKSSWRAVSAGTPIFISDFSKGIGKIPGKIMALPGRVAEALPGLSAMILRADDIFKIQLQMKQVSERLAQATDQLKTITIGGKNAGEIKGLKDKTSKDLAKFTGEDLKEIGLSAKEPIEDYLRYRDALQGVENLKSALEALKFQEKLAQISPDLLQVSSLEGAQLDQFIAKFNEAHPEGFKDKAFTIVKRGAEDLVALDEAGKLKKYIINQDTARTVLDEIKKADETLKGKSYELRQECLKRTTGQEGQILTYEAYTYGEIPDDWDKKISYLKDPDHWIPERREFHRQIVEQRVNDTLALSERLADSEPTIYMLRGNTASGKSFRLRNDDTFKKAADAEGKVSGAVNPDTYKPTIMEHDQGIIQQQAHVEASMLSDRVIEHARIRNPKLSEVWDRRFANIEAIKKMIVEAKSKGKKIKILDLETPLEISCQRVLNRKEVGSAPRTGFKVVTDGYEGIRQSRKELIALVDNDPIISDYVLYVTDKEGNAVKAVEKKAGESRKVLDDNLFKEAKSNATAPELQRVAAIKITDAYIKTVDPKMRPGLEKYKREPPITLHEALDEHASL